MAVALSSVSTISSGVMRPCTRAPRISASEVVCRGVLSKSPAKSAPSKDVKRGRAAPKRFTPKKKNPEQKSTAFKVSLPRKLLSSKGEGQAGLDIELGFTKSNELFVGRMAMLGFASSMLGELLTGKGPLAQFDIEVGVPLQDTEFFVLALIAFNLFAALAPASGKFVPDEKTKVTPETVVNNLIPTDGFGFTKANELFVGRMAQLGFAASLVGEVITGKGALAQFGLETGIPLSAAEPWILVFIFSTFLAAVNEGSGSFVKDDE
eukprot:jgi/Tetstr1/461940/TSEL_007018.t1